jgi:Ca2+-binding EF-hand superfamily protein
MLQYFHEAHHSLFHDDRYKGQASLVQKTLFDEGYIKKTKEKKGRGGSETLVFSKLRDIPDEVQARCVFNSIDFDGSGGLDLLELAQVFITNGVSTECTLSMCQMAFSNFDVNDDGVIDLKEFEAAFKPYYAYQFAEAYNLLKEAPRMLKNVINAPFQNNPSGCPFASQHMLHMDYDSAVLDWVTLVNSENHKSLKKAMRRVQPQLKAAAKQRDNAA